MKGLRRLLLVAAATAGLVLSLTGCSKTVDFLQYADVTFDGLNGQATATVNVDYNKIGTDVFGKGKSQTDMDEARTETAMMGEVNYEVTPSENLSNGDTVTLSVEVSDYFQKENKLTPPTIEIVGFLGGAARFIAKPCLKQRVMWFPIIHYGCSA